MDSSMERSMGRHGQGMDKSSGRSMYRSMDRLGHGQEHEQEYLERSIE